jgi:NAD(P)H-hydrate epimerase
MVVDGRRWQTLPGGVGTAAGNGGTADGGGEADPMTTALTSARIASLLPARPGDAHKYTFGRLLVIAGSITCPGAASLATAAAARVGTGLVVLGIGRSALHGPGRIPEVVLQILPEAEWGYLGEAAADEVQQKLGATSALLIGPGIGRDDSTRGFLARLLGLRPVETLPIGFTAAAGGPPLPSPSLPPVVLDADALTLLAEVPSWWERLTPGTAVLTPHAGEMARLLEVERLEDYDLPAARTAAMRWRQVVVLKGPTTTIAGPDGDIVNLGAPNPALATAGTGDVLAGCIAGLLAQGLSPMAAAMVGVHLHAQAGEMVAEELGEAGTLASDLLPRLPLAIRALRRMGQG